MKTLLVSLLCLMSAPAFAAFSVVAPQNLVFAKEGSLAVTFKNDGGVSDSLSGFQVSGSTAFKVSTNRCVSVPSGGRCLVYVTESLRGQSSSSSLSGILSSSNLTGSVSLSSSSSIAAANPAIFSISRIGSGDIDVTQYRAFTASFVVQNIGGTAGVPPINFSKDFDFFSADIIVNRCLAAVAPGKTCTVSVRIPQQKLSKLTFGIRSSITDAPAANQEVSFNIISNQPKHIAAIGAGGVKTYSDGTLARTCHYYAMSNAPEGVSGMYRIKPNDGLPAQDVYCNMDLDAAGHNHGYTMVAKAVGGSVPSFYDWQLSTTGFGSTNDGSVTFRLSDDVINAIRNMNAKISIEPNVNQHISVTVFDKTKQPGGPDYSVRFVSLDTVNGINNYWQTNHASAVGEVYFNANSGGGAQYLSTITFTDVNVGVWTAYHYLDGDWNNPYTVALVPMSAEAGSCGGGTAHIGLSGVYSPQAGTYLNIICNAPWPSDPGVYGSILIR